MGINALSLSAAAAMSQSVPNRVNVLGFLGQSVVEFYALCHSFSSLPHRLPVLEFLGGFDGSFDAIRPRDSNGFLALWPSIAVLSATALKRKIVKAEH